MELHEGQTQELLRLGGRRKEQCKIFYGVYQHALSVVGSLGMGLEIPDKFQEDDISSYVLFFEHLVTKLEQSSKDMDETIQVECCGLVETAAEHVFSNLYMCDADFPFEELLKKPEPEDEVKAASDAVAEYMVALAHLYKRGKGDDSAPSEGSLSGEDTGPDAEDPGTS